MGKIVVALESKELGDDIPGDCDYVQDGLRVLVPGVVVTPHVCRPEGEPLTERERAALYDLDDRRGWLTICWLDDHKLLDRQRVREMIGKGEVPNGS